MTVLEYEIGDGRWDLESGELLIWDGYDWQQPGEFHGEHDYKLQTHRLPSGFEMTGSYECTICGRKRWSLIRTDWLTSPMKNAQMAKWLYDRKRREEEESPWVKSFWTSPQFGPWRNESKIEILPDEVALTVTLPRSVHNLVGTSRITAPVQSRHSSDLVFWTDEGFRLSRVSSYVSPPARWPWINPDGSTAFKPDSRFLKRWDAVWSELGEAVDDVDWDWPDWIDYITVGSFFGKAVLSFRLPIPAVLRTGTLQRVSFEEDIRKAVLAFDSIGTTDRGELRGLRPALR